jgi:hypothetical protein
LYISCTKEVDPVVAEPDPPVHTDTFVPIQKLFGGSKEELFQYCAKSPDGGYVFAGHTFSSDGDVSGFHGIFDIWIVKVDSAGNLVWQKTFGGSQFDGPYGIVAAKNGGYIIPAGTNSTDGDVEIAENGAYRPWLLKIDEQGTIVWQKAVAQVPNSNILSLKAVREGGFIGSGLAENASKGWLFRLDEDGEVTWEKFFSGADNIQITDVDETTDGGFVLAGTFWDYDSMPAPDAMAIRVDKNGELQWQKFFGGAVTDYSAAIIATSDGGSLLASTTRSSDGDAAGNHGDWDLLMIRQAADGSVKWKSIAGGSDSDEHAFNSLLETPDGYFISVATTASSDLNSQDTLHGKSDGWIIKWDDEGNIVDQRLIGGSNDDLLLGIMAIGNGQYLVRGETNSSDGFINAPLHGDLDAWMFTLKF